MAPAIVTIHLSMVSQPLALTPDLTLGTLILLSEAGLKATNPSTAPMSPRKCHPFFSRKFPVGITDHPTRGLCIGGSDITDR